MSDDAVRAYAAEKRFSAGMLDRWLGLPPGDRAALLEVARRLRLGENQVRDVLDDAQDAAARRGGNLAQVFAAEPIAAVFRRGRGRNETLKALKLALRRLRYPQLSSVEDRLGQLAKALPLPYGVRVSVPPNLEGARITVTFAADSAPALRALARDVARALDRGEVEEMFRLLGGEW
jgi:hypothetical protein